jgi:hypothetical protein
MNELGLIQVSPRHAVKLAQEYSHLIQRAPARDYVVRTLSFREAGGLPLMSADLVIAGREAREQFPLAATYPLHFRKTYFPGRLHGDPQIEYQRHLRAAQIIGIPEPIGWSPNLFRSSFLPGKPYSRLSPFGVEPEESNVALARNLDLAAAAGLWRLLEEAFRQLRTLHEAGLAHGDPELHNFIVCPAPLELQVIDFENAVERGNDDAAWASRCETDLLELLREAIFLQCALGRQTGPLAELAWQRMDQLFKAPERFQREIDFQAEVKA